jgi:hypothetical protein
MTNIPKPGFTGRDVVFVSITLFFGLMLGD